MVLTGDSRSLSAPAEVVPEMPPARPDEEPVRGEARGQECGPGEEARLSHDAAGEPPGEHREPAEDPGEQARLEEEEPNRHPPPVHECVRHALATGIWTILALPRLTRISAIVFGSVTTSSFFRE